jgi:AsmA family protein
MADSGSISRRTPKWLLVLSLVVGALVLLIIFFPWDWLRQPINRYVSKELGRRFEITRHLDVKLGRVTTVIADGIELDNPEWARDRQLLKADAAEFDIRLWPLLSKQVVLPRIALKNPQIGLQAESDGRRTWALSSDTSKEGAAPEIGDFVVDGGSVNYLAPAQGADVAVKFSLAAESASEMPLTFNATGKWNREAFSATGRTGGVLRLSQNTASRFPLEVDARVGRTSLKAKGSVTDLANLSALDASFDLQGANLAELYVIAGVVLPATPAYRLRGNLGKNGKVWAARQIQGALGSSDLSGELSFDQTATVPLLSGKVQSRVLDFEDLAPIVGLPPASPSSKNDSEKVVSAPAAKTGKAPAPTPVPKPAPPPPASAAKGQTADQPRPGKVLPVAKLDLPRLNAMNADVTYSAAQVRRVRELPLDRGSLRVRLDAGVLQLDPIALGIAGGTVAGSIKVDSSVKPASLATRLDVRGVQLNKLFPTVETTKSSLGRMSGQFNLNGRGNSTAEMLATSSGDIAVLMGKGQISNILLEFIGLDGAEVIGFLVRGDNNVQLRCAVAAFDVKQGVLNSRAIVLDTVDTVVNGSGQVSLADETIKLRLEPQPKDASILSLRSPLNIGGTFASPSVGLDKTSLAKRAGLAVALGVINPLLALAATIETGPGEDTNCADVFAQGNAGKVPTGSRSAQPGGTSAIKK